MKPQHVVDAEEVARDVEHHAAPGVARRVLDHQRPDVRPELAQRRAAPRAWPASSAAANATPPLRDRQPVALRAARPSARTAGVGRRARNGLARPRLERGRGGDQRGHRSGGLRVAAAALDDLRRHERGHAGADDRPGMRFTIGVFFATL